MSNKLIATVLEPLSDGVCYYPMVTDSTGNNQPICPLNVSSVMVAAGHESVIESHQSKEVWVMVKGNGTIHSEGKNYSAQVGDVFYFDSYQNHKIKNNGESELILTSLWWPAESIQATAT